VRALDPDPLEERWEAVEDCERIFRDTHVRINAMGGNPHTVKEAVDRIETAGHPERFPARTAEIDSYYGKGRVPGYIDKMPKPTRLALEMALHEDQERRALERELWSLQQAWRQAEEIAEISDNLFLPEGTDEFIREHGGSPGHPGRSRITT